MKSVRLYFMLVFVLTGIFGTVQICRGQQLPVYSQYTFNAFLLNPAVAGSEGYTAINSTARQQWTGIEGAPSTFSISIQTRLMKPEFVETGASVKRRYRRKVSGRIGLGAYLYRDHIGLMDQTGGEFTYAYHLISKLSQLSFGLTVSVFQFRINTGEMRLPNPKDNLVNNEPLSMIAPDASLGVYYTNESFFLGFSAFHLSRASLGFGASKNFRLERQYNLTGGFQYPINDLYSIEPSAYLKISEQWRPQGDLTAKLIYDRKLWAGAGFRYPGMFIGSVGAKIDRFFFGYAYDYSSTALSSISYGTHEIMMAVKLGDNSRRFRWVERY